MGNTLYCIMPNKQTYIFSNDLCMSAYNGSLLTINSQFINDTLFSLPMWNCRATRLDYIIEYA